MHTQLIKLLTSAKGCRNIILIFTAVRRVRTILWVTVVDNVVRQELWDVDYPLTFGKLRKVPRESLIKRGRHGERQKLTSKQRLALLLSGRPNETESDSCISLLIHPQLCGTSPTCWNIMANKDEEIHGYSLTHRLLYLQIARQVRRNIVIEYR